MEKGKYSRSLPDQVPSHLHACVTPICHLSSFLGVRGCREWLPKHKPAAGGHQPAGRAALQSPSKAFSSPFLTPFPTYGHFSEMELVFAWGLSTSPAARRDHLALDQTSTFSQLPFFTLFTHPVSVQLELSCS